jgi:UDP-N-acetylglucosamine:LPS N-acetylglucosamine transferase
MDEPFVFVHPPWKSFIRFVFTLIKALIKILFDKPDVVISFGMGAVDVFVIPLCHYLGVYTIYVESGANTTYLSGTGKFVRKFCDKFIVKWEKLAEDIGAEYRGGIF